MPYGNINSIKIFIEKTEKNNEVCVDRSHGTYEYVLFRFMNRKKYTFISHAWSSISFNMKYKAAMMDAYIFNKLMISNNQQHFTVYFYAYLSNVSINICAFLESF